ncbi:MAG: 2-amino-4-hydroxy-6-hydroxymethyldihydropteridine diphosphokinase [Lachnospiraceae bacterium]|nr:2-amino-4-hydroxy-6-hydroxymethyldihydropteridine diphosphokinase [Lachnospiraceae bacterium]
MDSIIINKLQIFANHGVIPAENELGQKFIISAELFLDLQAAGESDDLSKTIDYSKVCDLIYRLTRETTFKLIERLGYFLCDSILTEFSEVKKVIITIDKPWAPLKYPMENVSVRVERAWHEVYLSVGSNMGDRKGFIEKGVKALEADTFIRDVKLSNIIETKPYGDVEQDNFLNAAIYVKTLYSPKELLKAINKIEADNHRERTIKWGPRTLDLDIIFYDDMIISEENLIIPHIDAINREFVLKPISELNPYIVHPIYKKTVTLLLEELYNRTLH